eukprot:GEMP01034076.1.p1 GENE.GEMP01034076.1~~GEMP01034076.1.p1  ORF type:complete len:623 (+),score=156.26 GEMP01034076.1:46-1914(+)
MSAAVYMSGRHRPFDDRCWWKDRKEDELPQNSPYSAMPQKPSPTPSGSRYVSRPPSTTGASASANAQRRGQVTTARVVTTPAPANAHRHIAQYGRATPSRDYRPKTAGKARTPKPPAQRPGSARPTTPAQGPSMLRPGSARRAFTRPKSDPQNLITQRLAMYANSCYTPKKPPTPDRSSPLVHQSDRYDLHMPRDTCATAAQQHPAHAAHHTVAHGLTAAHAAPAPAAPMIGERIPVAPAVEDKGAGHTASVDGGHSRTGQQQRRPARPMSAGTFRRSEAPVVWDLKILEEAVRRIQADESDSDREMVSRPRAPTPLQTMRATAGWTTEFPASNSAVECGANNPELEVSTSTPSSARSQCCLDNGQSLVSRPRSPTPLAMLAWCDDDIGDDALPESGDVVIGCLVSACQAGDMNRAMELYEKLKGMSNIPLYEGVYTFLIDGCVRAGMVGEALHFFDVATAQKQNGAGTSLRIPPRIVEMLAKALCEDGEKIFSIWMKWLDVSSVRITTETTSLLLLIVNSLIESLHFDLARQVLTSISLSEVGSFVVPENVDELLRTLKYWDRVAQDNFGECGEAQSACAALWDTIKQLADSVERVHLSQSPDPAFNCILEDVDIDLEDLM